MKLTLIIFTVVLIAHLVYAAQPMREVNRHIRVVRDATEVPDVSDKTPTAEDVKKFFEDLGSKMMAQVDKIATKENLDKVQDVFKNAMEAAQKGLEDLKNKADEALKSK